MPTFLLLLLAADPQQAMTLLRQGLVDIQQGRFPEARVALEESARLDPASPFVWSSLAETYWKLNEPAKSAEAAAHSEETSAELPQAWHALAIYYTHTGQFAKAGRWEAKFAASGKADAKAYERSATLFLNAGDFTQAAAMATSTLQKNSQDPQLVLVLGVARYGQRRFDDAIEAFVKVIRLDPSIEQPYLFLGRILDQAGQRLDEITAIYAKWMAANPNNAMATLLLAKAKLAAHPDDPGAESLLRRSIALDAANGEAHYQLGVLLETKRDWPGATSELERSAALNPQDAATHFHLARVYLRSGEPEKAARERQLHQELISK